MSTANEILDARLRDLLDRVAGESTSAAGGAAAATTVALAAGLAAMAARRSAEVWDGAKAAVGQAEVLQARAADLVQQSADAYETAAGKLAGEMPDGARPEQRDWQLGVALERAADVPLAFAEAAADIGELCIEVAEHCDPSARADAVAGALLAEAGVRVATHLVEINLVTQQDEERLARAGEMVARAQRSREKALALGS